MWSVSRTTRAPCSPFPIWSGLISARPGSNAWRKSSTPPSPAGPMVSGRRNSDPGSMGRACSFEPMVHFISSTSAIIGSPACSMPRGCQPRLCLRHCRSAWCSISNGDPTLFDCRHLPCRCLEWCAGMRKLCRRRRNILMPNLKLTLACWDYDRTRPLIDGRVKPHGVDLEVKMLRPRVMFPRMLEHKEFDASELSLASYASLLGRGDMSFRALPVAVSKIFRHSCIYIRPGSGIEKPEDLRGKRVGTTQWGSTAAVFMKGLIQDEYGVKPSDMRWFMGGLDAPTQAPLIPFTPPPGVSLELLPEGKTLEAMMEAGELDALFSIYLPKIFLNGSPNCKRLWPNFKEIEKDYYRRTKIFPIMHTIAMRSDVIAAH